MEPAIPGRGPDQGLTPSAFHAEAGDPGEVLTGPHAVLEALRAGRRHVRRILLARQERQGITGAVLQMAEAGRLPVVVLPREQLDRRARGVAHQGILAEVGPFPYARPEALLAWACGGAGRGFLVALDGIQDPQNLGAIVRTAEAAGADGLVLPRDRAAGVTPAAVRASAGASEHLPIARVTNLAAFLKEAQGAGMWVVGADPSGEQALYAAELTGPLALVIGAEGRGLRPLVRSRCDVRVKIPVRGCVASLNASAAAAVCIFEAMRQRERAGADVPVDSPGR